MVTEKSNKVKFTNFMYDEYDGEDNYLEDNGRNPEEIWEELQKLFNEDKKVI